MKRKSHTINVYVNTEVPIETDVDIELTELSDDDIRACVEEAKSRGLIHGTVGKDAMKVVLEELLRHRPQHAIVAFEAAFFADGHVLDVYRSMMSGHFNDAIAFADRCLQPTAAVTATKIPDDMKSTAWLDS